MNAVPSQYLGVWKRSLLTTGSGDRDTTTFVFWLQTPKLFADLRIPVPRPAEECSNLQDCNADQMVQLSQQQGFAGVTEVSGDVCTWHRELDFQPKSGPPDIGKMVFVSADLLTEDDPSGNNNYHEDWQRLQGSEGTTWAYRLQAADEPGRKGLLLGAGDFFFFAADRRVPLPSEGTLTSQVQMARSVDAQQALLGMELSFGVVDHSNAQKQWTITHSTLPGRTGQVLLPASQTVDSISSIGTLDLGALCPEGGWKLLAE